MTIMANKFNQIKDLRESFEFNLDDVSFNKFETTRALLNDFRSMFNVKALAVAAMMGLSVGALAAEPTPLTNIQDSFNKSVTIVNTNYNENLPTYFESKMTIDDDITLKNEFWKGSVVTLVVGDINDDATISDNKFSDQINIMRANKNMAAYVSQFDMTGNQGIDSKVYYATQSEYKHYFRNTSSELDEMKNLFKPENKKYFRDYVTYHEMAHGSFEQESSKIDDLNPIKLKLLIEVESHSDISSLLMIAQKHKLSYEEFRNLTLNVLEIRSGFSNTNGDIWHNSSVVLSEFIHTLDNNKNLYQNMSQEKISAFAAYFVHSVTNQDVNGLMKNMQSIGMPTRIGDFVDKFEDFREALKKVDSENGSIVTTPIKMNGAPYYMTMLENIYFEKNPAKFEEYNKNLVNGSVMKAAAIKVNAFNEIMNQNETEKAVYAVAAGKMVKDLSFITYSQMLSAFYSPDIIIKVHSESSLSDVFKANKKEINQIISAEKNNKPKI
jgi:hypothetical protein